MARRYRPMAPLTLPTMAALLLVWLVALELGLLPWALERSLTHRAEAGPRPPASIWFVDQRAEERRAREGRSAEVRDNPALW